MGVHEAFECGCVDVVVAEAYLRHAALLQASRTQLVVLDSIVVNWSIELEHQTKLDAEEVDDVPTKYVLSPELVSEHPPVP